MSEKVRWAGLQKLQEECAELLVEAAKLSAFPSGEHPDGEGPLIERLNREMSDVFAILTWMTAYHPVIRFDYARIGGKMASYSEWCREGHLAGAAGADDD